MTDAFPSMDIDRTAPFGWVQWKGTNVCLDIHCTCGALAHYDGGFCYHVKCASCGQVYECDGHIVLRPLATEPEGTHPVYDDPPPWETREMPIPGAETGQGAIAEGEVVSGHGVMRPGAKIGRQST